MTEPLRLPTLSICPERRALPESAWERAEAAAMATWHSWRARVPTQRAAMPEPDAHDARLRASSDAALSAEALALRASSCRNAPDQRTPPQTTALALALAREAASRALGQRAHDVQMAGAGAALRGAAVEMATGEGKTLTAALTAAAAALTGVPSVHLVTANDYLAERDAATTAPVYRLLGLSCGAVAGPVPPAARRAAYRRDVTVCSGKDLAFDYMRDRLHAGRRVGELRRRAASLAGASLDGGTLLRGLHFALVDEADSVLIDEARTPLILSGDAAGARAIRVWCASSWRWTTCCCAGTVRP